VFISFVVGAPALYVKSPTPPQKRKKENPQELISLGGFPAYLNRIDRLPIPLYKRGILIYLIFLLR